MELLTPYVFTGVALAVAMHHSKAPRHPPLSSFIEAASWVVFVAAWPVFLLLTVLRGVRP